MLFRSMLVGYKGVSVYHGETITVNNGELKDGDLVDKYTGKSYRNNIGDVCEMKRRQVCDDHTIGCDSGLHVGTFEYASDWAGAGGVVVLVKFNPKDIVSVPSDCECQKMRVCKYEVVDIARGILEEPVYASNSVADEIEDEHEYDDDYDDDYLDDDRYHNDNYDDFGF